MRNHVFLKSVYDSVEQALTIFIPGLITVLIGIFITLEIISRLLLNYSFFGVVDIVGLGTVLLTFLTIAEVQKSRSHIAVDILQEKLKQRRAGPILDCVLLSLSILGMTCIFGAMIWYSFHSFKRHLTTITLYWPEWPFVMAMTIGALLMILRLIAQLKESLLRVIAFGHSGVDISASSANNHQ